MHKITFFIMDILSSIIKFSCITNVELGFMIIVLRYLFTNILNIKCIVHACGDNCNATTHVVIVKSSIFLLSSWSWWIRYFTQKKFSFPKGLWNVWKPILVDINNAKMCFCSSIIVDVSNIWGEKLIGECWFSTFKMIDLDGFGGCLYFGFKYGCNSNILLKFNCVFLSFPNRFHVALMKKPL